MAEHEPCIGATDDWYTPPDIFDALGLIFDLDPCSPGPAHWVPARKIYTKEDDGLVQPWSGTVIMNPPFGRRNGHVPWLRKFLAHGDGVAIVRAYTSSAWFHQWAVKAQTMCFFLAIAPMAGIWFPSPVQAASTCHPRRHRHPCAL